MQAPTKPPSGLTSRGRLGDGEWEAIALAVELGAGAILIDDRPARRLAEGLHVIGTLGVLLEAKRAGHVRAIRAELDKLLETSFFLSPQLYDQLLIMGQVESMLGPGDQTEKWRDWHLIYHLGPARRGLFRIDSEWLVIRFDQSDRVMEYRIVGD